MNERRPRRLSQAIADGEGISLLVEVGDAAAARLAETAGADGVLVRAGGPTLRAATELPLVWCADGPDAASSAQADACLLVAASHDDWDELVVAHERALQLGLEPVVEVRDEEELEEALEHLDPEILLLAGPNGGRDGDPLDHVLELLQDVPAGKLAVAQLAAATREDVDALERAGVDAVVVEPRDLAALVRVRIDAPPV